MPESIRAVVVDPSSDAILTLRDVALALAAPNDVTVRVTAISLNRGEVNRALSGSETGARPGWDFAGMVEAHVLPHAGMLPSGPSIASPECSRRRVSLSIDYEGSAA